MGSIYQLLLNKNIRQEKIQKHIIVDEISGRGNA